MAGSQGSRKRFADDDTDLPEETELIDEPVGDRPITMFFKDAPGLDGRASNLDVKSRLKRDKSIGQAKSRKS